ncbi:Putative ribonuclease H protein At1g65750 [Linum perenne]
MSPPKQSRGPDDWVWGCEKSGIFTIKSAYNLICRTETAQDSDRWKCVWSWAGPNRIRYFLWLAAKERLVTNTARLRRGLTQDASCPQCAAREESIAHILRDCPFAVETWRRVEGVDINGGVWQEPYQTWLQVSLRSDADLKFGITCWYLWRARNERIFANSTENPATVAFKCSLWRATVQKAMKRDAELVDGQQPNGSVNRGKAAASGILRDSNGKGLLAYTMNLGICSITKAEIRGALEGIKRAWEAGYRKVEIQLDSQAAIAILNDKKAVISHSHGLEVMDYRDWLSRDWEVDIKHIYREANYAADHLASRGHTCPRGSHCIDLTDCRLAHFLRYDCMGISEPRLIISN